MTDVYVQEPHRHGGIFIARGKEDLLVTKNMTPGESAYGEKRISVEDGPDFGAMTNGGTEEGSKATKTEYRVWNPFRSKLSAGVLGGIDEFAIGPGKKVMRHQADDDFVFTPPTANPRPPKRAHPEPYFSLSSSMENKRPRRD